MSDRLGFGWQFIGTILCGFFFAIPIALAYYIARFIQRFREKRKEKDAEEHSVV